MKKINLFYTVIIILIALITVISIMMIVHHKSDNQTETDTKSEVKNKNIHIAIVNEDQQTTYNGEKINLGEPFIDRLSGQDKYKFETVSRSIAENGLKQGTYQVMLVIPKDFSKLAMQLDEKTPNQMSIQYKTAVGQKERVAKETEQVVSNVLNDFNKNLIKIYLTSIIDNLHNAQDNVGDIMKREQNVSNRFSDYLLNPLNDFPALFTDALVNSLGANQGITKMIHNYNNSLLSSDSNIFNINTNHSASAIVQDQSVLFDQNLSAMEKTLQDYKAQKDSVELSGYIDQLKQINNQLEQQSKSDERSKEVYKNTFEDNLENIKDNIKKEESPFTEKMVNNYKQKLTESMKTQLDNSQDLKDALEDSNNEKIKLQDTMVNNIRNTIEHDGTDQDKFYIRNMSVEDLRNAGLTDKTVNEYQEILNNVEEFKEDFNKAHLGEHISQENYHGELSAEDTTKLIEEGVNFERKETIKSKDINQLTVATDPNFNFEGTVYVNGKKYDVKDQDIELDTTKRSFDVEVKGVARLKGDDKYQKAFLEDKIMHLQLLFGQADKKGIDNEEKPNENQPSVVDLSISHNLEGQLIRPEIKQQLRALDRFKAQYNIYKDMNVKLEEPKISNEDIADMMVNEVIKDMERFKTDKTTLIKQIDSLDNSSDKMIEDLLDNKDQISKNKKDITTLVDDLSETEKVLNEDPDEPKISKEKDGEFTTLSTNLDKEVSKLSDRSTQLLSDSQETKSISDSISGELNQLDNNVNNLHASGKSLGRRANDLNKEMAQNDEDNQLFAKDFEKVLVNSKDGDRQNEALKAFMSNPIQKKNLENVLANDGEKDTLSSTILVLLMYLIAMMTGYVFYSYERAKGSLRFIKQEFSKNNELWNNFITSGIIATTALIEGVIIGIIAMNRYGILSGYKLRFMFMIMITMMVFVLINSYLLRQIKSIGMFIMILVLAMYFVVMDHLNPASNSSHLNKFSPLSYIDTIIFNYLNAEHPVGVSLIILTVIAIIAFILNVLIKNFKKNRLI
ncbi:type VII secretion protein EsaA [Staphylococcus xylosus]|uniref:type VII secretion protein EsaA n=1 Tax=Staphylococcus xylosus TaxID=1288 RepID=UPI001CDBD6C5|nr:type VII secretion protein EsaA [Staphylococcus xylosus]MCM3518708.1 type VII secretion protein EsaA [Staphylococcus xylosus]MCQ3817438.1 type VII secretion protein EsaA [Staphylococcus xylosus]MCQ3820141.1 type VII secretion protein EsaA [Staphylococcus xylosus]UBV37536.1 type VII secretion protein EsaA [Staphylococcus xylosus]